MYFDLINIFQKIFCDIYKEKWRNVDWMIFSKMDLQFIKSFSSYPHPMHSPYFKTNKMCNISALGLVPTQHFNDMYNDTEGILIKFADDIKLGAIANTLSN